MPRISIIMRSMNDDQVIGKTLKMVAHQTITDFELVNIDSGSTDATLDIIREYNPHPMKIRPDQYVPGWVLNRAARAACGEILVFLNSDCTPANEYWLEELIAPLEAGASAVYGRQEARPDAQALVRRDYEVAFPHSGGDTRTAMLGNGSWLSFFSMASSATLRSIWEEFPFDNDIQYSEDILWARTLRKAEHRVAYAPRARVFHSHNYTLSQAYKRFIGEGAADAQIFERDTLRESLPLYVAVPYLSAVAKDTVYCVRGGEYSSILHSVALRAAQKLGRWVGLRQGRRMAMS